MTIMKKFFNYIYYRIAKAYKASGDKDYLDWGYWVIFASFGFILLGIISIVLHALQGKIGKTVFIIVFSFVGILNVYYSLFVDGKRKQDKFNQLEECYKDESRRRLNGWLVFLYILGAILFSVICVAWAGYGE